MAEFVIASLAGGLNDSDPPIALADDQCVTATNVEFHRARLGERRMGGTAIDLTGSDLVGCSRIVWGHRHLPTIHPSEAQLWLLGITDGAPSTATLAYKDTTWHTVAMADALTIDGASEYQVNGVTLHGKLFIAYNSAVNYLHVWDGTSLRRVGLIQPSAAPTAANAGSGSFVTTRYYRTRETVQAAGVTIRRSEPSTELTFVPSGTGLSATVTRGAVTNPQSTHWELEGSTDNADYYLLATTAIGTTTASDTSDDGAYAANGYSLVEDIGDYEVPHSARLLMADEDRLLLFGHWEDTALDSTASWTPVSNATGVGNDERITLDPVSVVNLDGSEGGSITDIGRWAPGEVCVGKNAHVYKLIRTGQLGRAYDAFVESKEIGVIPGSMAEGVDEAGAAALYFLDYAVGPYRFTQKGGLQACGGDVFETWQTVNVDATHVVARGLYHRTKKQLHWRIATGAANIPDVGLVVQTNAMRAMEGGEARRGFTKWTGSICGALTMFLFSDNIDDDTARSRTLVPFIGVEGGGLVWRCDTGDDDNGTEYAARITTKPFAPTQLQTDFEIKAVTLVGKASTGASLIVSAIANGGTATTKTAETISMTPVGSETFVIRKKDELHIAELKTVQMDFADIPTPGARWELARYSITFSGGQGA